MSVVVQTSNLIATGTQVSIANGETFDEVAGVSIISTNAANAIVCTVADAVFTVEINGQAVGGDDAIYDTQSGVSATVDIGAFATVQGATGTGIDLTSYSNIINYGEVSGANGGMSLGDAAVTNYGSIAGENSDAIDIGGQGVIYNYGSLSGPSAVAFGTGSVANYVFNAGSIAAAFGIVDDASNALNPDVIVNNGTIEGVTSSIQANGTSAISLTNSGTMDGQVILTGGVATVNNSGLIVGLVNLSAKSSLVNGGRIDGNVTAGAGVALTDSGVITGTVALSSGTVNLYDTQITISGSGDTVNLVTGPSDVVNLSGNAAWNNIVGSNGTINLSNALTGVVGGFDTINFVGTTTDTVSLWNTEANWDNIFGSNGSVYLNHAITGIVGGGNNVYFNTGTDNIASLWNTNGAWDNVYGSSNTVYLSDAYSGVVGGGDAVEFFYGTANAASLWNTGGAADVVTNNSGAAGTVYVNNAQVDLVGSGDVVDFTYAGANSVYLAGDSETIIAQPVSGSDAITGFNSTDQVYLSASQFGSSWSAFLANDVTQSGSNTLITDPANHANVLTLVGVAPSSLSQANFHFG